MAYENAAQFLACGPLAVGRVEPPGSFVNIHAPGGSLTTRRTRGWAGLHDDAEALSYISHVQQRRPIRNRTTSLFSPAIYVCMSGQRQARGKTDARTSLLHGDARRPRTRCGTRAFY